MREVKEITSEQKWNTFVDGAGAHTFLQSWEWGELGRAMGSKIWRLGVLENGKIEGVMLAVKVEARRGRFLFVPHGPIINWANGEAFDLLIRELKKIAKEENAVFIRIAPSEKKSEEGMGVLGALGLRPSPIHTHAELLWLLDLSPSEEDLLKNMRKQTRYSIQKAGKDGVLVEISAKPEDAERFYEIYETTAQEQKFHAFSREYIASEFKAFAGAGSVKFFFARYKGEIVSAAMIIFSKHEAFYHHGASLKKYPQLTASHLLQWEVIREARRRGCRIYNFWGISPPDNRKHPWAGLSLFKRGFGGYAEEFISSHDLPLSYKYWLNFMVEKARKLYRGF